jgi:hypothetical protein
MSISGPRGYGWGGLAAAGFARGVEKIRPAGLQFPLSGLWDRLILRPVEDSATAQIEEAGKLGVRLEAEDAFHGGFGHVHGQ